MRGLYRIKTRLFDFKRDFAALLAEIVGIRAWQERPRPLGLPDFRKPADKLCEALRRT